MTHRFIFSRDGEQAVVVNRMAVKMHADDADGARRDERFDVRQIHDECVVNVGEHRLGAEVHQRFHASEKPCGWAR